jgi:hypothetical protein
MSNKESIKNKVGRPRANTHRVALTLSQDDYELLEEIASLTSTRPATMIRDIILENRPMLLALRDSLRALLNGDSETLTGLASKMLFEVQRQSSNAQQEIQGFARK